MYKHGDQVKVVGYGNREATLRVWEVKVKGLLLCSELGYHRAKNGGELVAVGFPMADIAGLSQG